MCEINPKRKEFYRIEFFTSHIVTDEEWRELVIGRLARLEQEFNEYAGIRVHIHPIEEPSDG